MSWSIGYDPHWSRDIGYGVTAYCDHPRCNETIDRGLGCVCGGDPYGGEKGCGLYFCEAHLLIGCEPQRCPKCARYDHTPYKPKPEHPEWMQHVLTDSSWKQWRKENPKRVGEYTAALKSTLTLT